MNEAASHSKFDQLRCRAEELLRECGGDKRAVGPGTDILTIIDELEIRQAQLQVQLDGLPAARRRPEEFRKGLLSILDAVPAPVYLEAPDCSIRFANRAFRETFGDPEAMACDELFAPKADQCENPGVVHPLGHREWAAPEGKFYSIHTRPFKDIDGSSLLLKLIFDISARKRLEEEVKAGDERLREANAALKALVRQIQEERTELEESLLNNVQHLIVPCLARLKKSCVAEAQRSCLEMIESHLQEIASRFVHRLSSRMLGLSPSEIRVACLIRHGKSSKEIAELLGLSERAVVFHRQSIRRKLGLTGSKLNLQTYLDNLQ